MKIRDIITENQPGATESTNDFSRNIEAFRVYQHLDPMEFYNFANTPRGLQILAQKAGTTPESVKDSLERMDWGQFPAEFYQDPEDDEQGVAEAKARYEMTDPGPGTAPRGRGRPPGIKHPIGYIDNRDDGQPRIGRVEKTATGIKHLARPERGGVEPTADPLATLDKSTTNRLDRAFGVKWPKEKKMQGSIDLTALDSDRPGVAEDLILNEGIIDFISKSKDKFLRLKDALSDEWAQSKEMWRIVQKGNIASQKEINFANTQFKDILRVVGLAAWYSLPIPGNTLLILTTEKLLNKIGMSIIPDKIRNQVLTPTKQGVAEGYLTEDPVTSFASKAHDEWRQGWIKQNGGKSMPRVKKNSDGSEGDINVPFEKLHPDWQRENLAAGQAAMQAVKQFPNDIEKAAEFIHIQWMKRNPKADYNAAQHVPYDQLSEPEKEKDRVHVRTMQKLMGKPGVAEGTFTNLLSRLKGVITKVFAKKLSGPAGSRAGTDRDFQRMMAQITGPVDSNQYARLWAAYKSSPRHFVSIQVDDIDDPQKMHLWASSIVEFLLNRYPDADPAALARAVTGLVQLASQEALGGSDMVG